MGFIGLASLLEEKIDALSLEIFNGLIPHKALRYKLGRSGAQETSGERSTRPHSKEEKIKRKWLKKENY